ncbi:unnamed protein product [Amoebophrya sp. A120]|nr:unnamed protein product [Amoebophrya sp. A120]|eukprot:GSA120T00011893001.1
MLSNNKRKRNDKAAKGSAENAIKAKKSKTDEPTVGTSSPTDKDEEDLSEEDEEEISHQQDEQSRPGSCDEDEISQEHEDSQDQSESGEPVMLAPVTILGHRVLPGVVKHTVLENQPLGVFTYEDNFRNAEDLETAKQQCEILQTKPKTSDAENENYSAGNTYWIGANDEPKFLLEKLAKEIFLQYTKEIPIDFEDNVDESENNSDDEDGQQEAGATSSAQEKMQEQISLNKSGSFQMRRRVPPALVKKNEQETLKSKSDVGVEQEQGTGVAAVAGAPASGDAEQEDSNEDFYICNPCKDEDCTELQGGNESGTDAERNELLGRDLTAPVPASISGAEYWAVVLDDKEKEDSDNVDLHFDKDYILEEDHKVNLHPLFGSVLYLTNHGAPTVVTAQREEYMPAITFNLSPEKGLDSNENMCVVSYPRAGKHVVFDGQLLHFADGSLAQQKAENRKRIALLVNIWVGHRPVECLRMEEDTGKRKLLEKIIAVEKKENQNKVKEQAEGTKEQKTALSFTSPGLIHVVNDKHEVDQECQKACTFSKKFKSSTNQYEFGRCDWVNFEAVAEDAKEKLPSTLFYPPGGVIDVSEEGKNGRGPGTAAPVGSAMKKKAAPGAAKKKQEEHPPPPPEEPMDAELVESLIGQGEALKTVFLTTHFPGRDAGNRKPHGLTIRGSKQKMGNEKEECNKHKKLFDPVIRLTTKFM